MTVSEQLRKALHDSGLTLYAIARDSGVPWATAHRFVRGRTGLTTKSIDALCELLDLELAPRKRRPAAGRKSKGK